METNFIYYSITAVYGAVTEIYLILEPVLAPMRIFDVDEKLRNLEFHLKEDLGN